MKRYSIIIILLTLVLILPSCADVSNVEQCLPLEPEPYGFWSGLWHGMISPIAWIGSLFMDDVAIYAVNNNGGWYDFGFVMGIGGLSGGAGKASNRR